MLDYFRFKEIHDLYLQGHTEEARRILSDLQTEYINLCDENSILRTQIQGYEDILYLSRNLIFDGSFYWLITGSIKHGPFCPVCYNRDGLILRLTDDGISRHCFTCGSTFDRRQPEFESPPRQQAVSGMAQGNEYLGQSSGIFPDSCASPKSRRRATIIPFSTADTPQGGC